MLRGSAFPLLRSPSLQFMQILNNWHAPRLRLVDGRWELVGVHEGIDILSERGTPVVALAAGTVTSVGWQLYSGQEVGVSGADGRYYFYAHFSTIAPGIALGRRVGTGTLLGVVGNTGYGPPGTRDQFPAHLHLGIQSGGAWIDPYRTLVSLYAGTVAAEDRTVSSLDALAMRGDAAGWRALAARAFEHPGLAPRE